MVWFWIQFFRGAPYFFYQIKKDKKEHSREYSFFTVFVENSNILVSKVLKSVVYRYYPQTLPSKIYVSDRLE